jgi:hypothetical protein
MSRTTPDLENRLARYRPALDNAIADRTARAASDPSVADPDLIELDWLPVDAQHSSNRSRVLVGASAAVLIGGLAVIVATRDNPPATPTNSATSPDAATAPEGTTSTGVVIDTNPATTIEGTGLTPACPPGTDTIGTGTLYLGGPAWDQNLAAPGFIFSLPTGPTLVDVAIKAIALPVIGQECSIIAAPTPDAGTVIVTVSPPAVPTPLRLDVNIVERDGIVGVTGIRGSTSFETNHVGDQASLTLIDGIPASATRVQVRFKKGDDVWELTADPTLGTAIELAVPNGETDHFPDQAIDWVLFTAIDGDEHVVDAGGGLL